MPAPTELPRPEEGMGKDRSNVDLGRPDQPTVESHWPKGRAAGVLQRWAVQVMVMAYGISTED